jgi:hypothetical protein
MGIKKWFGNLAWIDKMLMGIGGVIMAIITSVVGVLLAVTVKDIEDSVLWNRFKLGLTVFEKFWEPLDAWIKGKNKDKNVETVRYGIDQGLDMLDGIIDGPELVKLLG